MLQLRITQITNNSTCMSHQPTFELEFPLANWFSTSFNLFQVLHENRLIFIVQLLLRDNNSRHASINKHAIYKYTSHIHLKIEHHL